MKVALDEMTCNCTCPFTYYSLIRSLANKLCAPTEVEIQQRKRTVKG